MKHLLHTKVVSYQVLIKIWSKEKLPQDGTRRRYSQFQCMCNMGVAYTRILVAYTNRLNLLRFYTGRERENYYEILKRYPRMSLTTVLRSDCRDL